MMTGTTATTTGTTAAATAMAATAMTVAMMMPNGDEDVGVYTVMVCRWTDHILARNPLLEVEADLS